MSCAPEPITSTGFSDEGFIVIPDQMDELFGDPADYVITGRRVRKKGETLSVGQAQARIDEWARHASEQDKSINSDKTILSLFDYTGNWARPYAEAGYNVICFDLQSGQDILDFCAGHFIEDWDFGDVYGILAACPCTDFASCGAKHFARKDAAGQTQVSIELVHQTLRTVEFFRPVFWVVENPVGRIGRLAGLPKPRMSWEPHHFGSPYTKKTMLWGKFNAEFPLANVDPTEGSKMHRMYGGSSQKTKNARSETPEGFAYAFFMANNYQDATACARLGGDYPGTGVYVGQALDAGMSEDWVREIIYRHYESDEPELACQALLDALDRMISAPVQMAT